MTVAGEEETAEDMAEGMMTKHKKENPALLQDFLFTKWNDYLE